MPGIRPLETLHNALSLRQLDAFLGFVTSATFKQHSSPTAEGGEGEAGADGEAHRRRHGEEEELGYLSSSGFATTGGYGGGYGGATSGSETGYATGATEDPGGPRTPPSSPATIAMLEQQQQRRPVMLELLKRESSELQLRLSHAYPYSVNL